MRFGASTRLVSTVSPRPSHRSIYLICPLSTLCIVFVLYSVFLSISTSPFPSRLLSHDVVGYTYSFFFFFFFVRRSSPTPRALFLRLSTVERSLTDSAQAAFPWAGINSPLQWYRKTDHA
ncbi:hypothetical protein B0F90DRAFT_224546 [Multifurca ochricompacta]|uniref:Uncharacterized protein n=1 Tax=Multifurca ochricompacta TaxID=376703 RepID=A0AAD4QJW3_9AGAM|nr:hypothetical protein B0F90DRAFT_224546 [Multifurca ochricompacta]